MPEKVSQKSTKYFSLTCRMLFTWTGSCARGHDLHPILHTWSQFVPAAGRSAGISPVFSPHTHAEFTCSYENADPPLDLVTELVGQSQRAPEDIPTGAAGSGRREEEVSSQLLQEDDVVQ